MQNTTKSVLNNQFSQELNILDSLFGKLLDSIFVLESPHFYTPNAHNIQLIANTFDIDTQDEQDYIATKLTQKPILKKTKLGTYNGIKEVIEPIFGAVDIQTHASNERLEPFTFSIAIEPSSSSNIMDLKKASQDDLRAYLAEVLPAFDRDRVHVSDIKKLISWYNLLVANGMTDFEEVADTEEQAEDAEKGE